MPKRLKKTGDHDIRSLSGYSMDRVETVYRFDPNDHLVNSEDSSWKPSDYIELTEYADPPEEVFDSSASSWIVGSSDYDSVSQQGKPMSQRINWKSWRIFRTRRSPKPASKAKQSLMQNKAKRAWQALH